MFRQVHQSSCSDPFVGRVAETYLVKLDRFLLFIMEDTDGNLHNSRNDLKKSTGRQDDGPYSSITTHISSGDNSKTKTLIEYENDETMEIKEEIIQDQVIHESGDHNFEPEKSHPDERSIFFDKSFGGRMLIKYENDETLEIKEEIFQDQQRKLSGNHNLHPDKNQLEGRSIFSVNNSGCRTVIEYDNDETMEIKEEIIQDRDNTDQTYNKKYELQLCTKHIRVDDIFAKKAHECTPMKQKLQESKRDKKNKSKTSQPRSNGAKCTQSYTRKGYSIQCKSLGHAAVKPQFLCDFCGYKASRKSHLSTHIPARHFKELNTSQVRHTCHKCSRSYSSLRALKRHELLKHAAVKPQFICDFCGYKTNRKHDLSTHIRLRHFKDSTKSQAEHTCDKCFRNYSSISGLYKHKRFKHAAVKTQFICDICSYETDVKCNLSRHILSRHFKKSTTFQARNNCDKCFRSYSLLSALNRHDRLKHPQE